MSVDGFAAHAGAGAGTMSIERWMAVRRWNRAAGVDRCLVGVQAAG